MSAGFLARTPAGSFAGACLAASLCFLAACSDRAGPAIAERVDTVFAEWDRPGSPGCSVSVSRNGDVLFARAYGFANLDHEVPNTVDTVFHVASLSKQFTAAAVALLAVEGKLSLDDDVREYVPELPDFGTPITIRHLVHHTSGLRDQWTLLILNGWRYSQDLISNDDVLSVLQKQKHLNFAPGERHLYSNSGYTLLARIIERVSGQDLRQFAKARFFTPLGMRHTFFRDNFREIVKGQAYGYVPAGDTFELGVTNFDTVGATSLLTTAGDLARWARNFETGHVGGAPFLEIMADNGRLNDGSEVNYAFGTVRGRYRGLDTVGHSGSDAGYTAHLLRFPEQQVAIACLCNVPTDPAALARRTADIFLVDAMSPESEESGQPESTGNPAASSRDSIPARPGYYFNDDTDEFLEISAIDDELRIHNWSMDLRLHRLDPDWFRVGGYGVYVRFVADDTGASALELRWGDAEPDLYASLSPAALSASELLAYAGTYTSNEIGVPYQIRPDDNGGLYLEWPKYYRQPLRPGFSDVFFSNVAGTVQFRRDADGVVTGFDLSRPGRREIVFDKH